MTWDHGEISKYREQIAKEKLRPFETKIVNLTSCSNLENLSVMLECGNEQRRWDNEVPNRVVWPRGISFSSRKNYSNHLWWLKYSRSFRSGILARLSWAAKNMGNARFNSHNLPFATDPNFFAISWDKVDAARGIHVFIAENDDWSQIIRALTGTANASLLGNNLFLIQKYSWQ